MSGYETIQEMSRCESAVPAVSSNGLGYNAFMNRSEASPVAHFDENGLSFSKDVVAVLPSAKKHPGNAAEAVSAPVLVRKKRMQVLQLNDFDKVEKQTII